VNLGGVSLQIGSELQFSVDGNTADFVIEQLLVAVISLREMSHLNRGRVLPLDRDSLNRGPKSFIEKIYVFVQHLHQCPKSIVSRLNAFGRVKDEVDESDSDDQETGRLASDSHPPSRRTWKLAESEKLRDLILKGHATMAVLRVCFPDCFDFALRSKRNAIL
jgi:hypothetical protein